MLKSLLLFAFAGLLFMGCSKEELSQTESVGTELSERSGNPVIHHVSVGGNDICASLGNPPGCDKNFSLTAVMRADGSVTGQWQDGLKGDESKGLHVEVTCLKVDGNTAIISGIIKSGVIDGQDVTGLYAMTAVVDNGTSSKDPLDQISFSYIYQTPRICGNYISANFPLADLEIGQVKVK